MKPRVLFVHNHPSRFVQDDLALLSERCEVHEWHVRSRRVNPGALARAVAGCDLVYAWFASWHSFMPLQFAVILKRPSVLVVGGYDTANMPAIGYGSQRGGARRWIARRGVQLAGALIANSRFARDEAIRNAGADPRRLSVLYHGFDADRFRAETAKTRMAMTAGNVERANLQRKGLEPFVRAAAFHAQTPFVLVGGWRDGAIDDLRRIAGPNVSFTGWVEDSALQCYYARAAVYVQASRHEGFGMAAAEAMLSECVPVVTRAGALPEVVGDNGVYLDEPEPEPLAQAITQGLDAGREAGRKARQWIGDQFTMERRRTGLYAIIERALSHAV